MAKRKAPPPGCYWRGDTLYGRIQRSAAKGGDIRWSLQTDDPTAAYAAREKAVKTLREIEARGGNASELFTNLSESLPASIAETAAGPLYDDVLAGFVRWHAANAGSLETARRYASSLEQLHPHLSGKRLLTINRKTIKGIVQARSESGVTNATIRRDLTALSQLFAFAIMNDEEDLIEDNPALAAMEVGLVKEKRDPIILPSHAHIEMVRQRAPEGIARMIHAALVTGCRQDELVTLTCDRIDFNRKQITVIGKGNKLRTVDVRPFEGWRAFEHCSGRTGYAFTHGEDSERYNSVAVRFHELVKSVQKQAQKAGTTFRPMTFHHIRHRHAVDWLQEGRSIYALQLRLGHTSVKTTEVYTQYLPDDLRLQVMFGGQEQALEVARQTGTR